MWCFARSIRQLLSRLSCSIWNLASSSLLESYIYISLRELQIYAVGNSKRKEGFSLSTFYIRSISSFSFTYWSFLLNIRQVMSFSISKIWLSWVRRIVRWWRKQLNKILHKFESLCFHGWIFTFCCFSMRWEDWFRFLHTLGCRAWGSKIDQRQCFRGQWYSWGTEKMLKEC